MSLTNDQQHMNNHSNSWQWDMNKFTILQKKLINVEQAKISQMAYYCCKPSWQQENQPVCTKNAPESIKTIQKSNLHTRKTNQYKYSKNNIIEKNHPKCLAKATTSLRSLPQLEDEIAVALHVLRLNTLQQIDAAALNGDLGCRRTDGRGRQGWAGLSGTEKGEVGGESRGGGEESRRQVVPAPLAGSCRSASSASPAARSSQRH